MSTINNTGANALTYIFTLIKNKFVQKVYKTGSSSVYKTLSDNDLTDALKAQYDAAYAHSQAAHAPSTAQANVIETVKVNGTALTPTNKAVEWKYRRRSAISRTTRGLSRPRSTSSPRP